MVPLSSGQYVRYSFILTSIISFVPYKDMNEPTIFLQAGISYFRIRYPSIEQRPSGWTKYKYVTIHVPSGRRFQNHVYLETTRQRPSLMNLQRLLDFWGGSMPKMWAYEAGAMEGWLF